MKKVILLLLFSISFLLAGCSSKEYVAEEEMIEDKIFSSQGNNQISLYFMDDELTVRDESKETLEVTEYGPYELTTKKDQFILTFDDDSKVVFTRVGERIIEDEEGITYDPN